MEFLRQWQITPMGLTEVFRELAAAKEAGVFERYALGGAVAATVYLEPTDTEDVDIFVTLSVPPGARLLSLDPLYGYFKGRGANVEGERLTIGGWLVQFLPPPTPLVDDALASAVVHDIDGQLVPVFSPEHLAAIALETGRLKDKVRLQQFLAWSRFDRGRFVGLIARFGLDELWVRAQQFFQENA